MINYRNQFNEIYAELKLTHYWQDMVNTVEGSKWHREENVAVHTEMVLNQFFERVNVTWTVKHFICAIVLLFHDTGKPAARTKKYSEERGEYYGFGGHELLSARIFETWVIENWDRYELSSIIIPQTIYDIVWLIQNHLPYNVVKEAKLVDMRTTINAIFGSDYELFRTMVLSDQYGRISDDHGVNKLAIHDWFDFKLKMTWPLPLPPNLVDLKVKLAYDRIPHSSKTVYMLIGAPGTGKSTYTKKLVEFDKDIQIFNYDSLRLEWYPSNAETDIERYYHAHQQSIEDKQFESKTKQRFAELLQTGKSIIVDNTNTTDKRRNQLLLLAKQQGYNTVALIFPISKNTLMQRNVTRTDHKVPEHVINDMYNRLTYPTMGALVDSVKVIKLINN